MLLTAFLWHKNTIYISYEEIDLSNEIMREVFLAYSTLATFFRKARKSISKISKRQKLVLALY